MPDTFTSILGLVKPEVGSSRDTWGAKTNGNWDKVDSHIMMAMPVGAVLDFAGPYSPPGWIVCDGRQVSRVTYSALFTVLGTYWGAGDGSTTFNLPPFTGRSGVGPGMMTDPAGNDRNFVFGTWFGVVQVTLEKAHLPDYVMTSDSQGHHAHGGQTVDAGSHGHITDAAGVHAHYENTGAAGAHSHNGSVSSDIGIHTHGYAQPVFGAGNWVQGASGTQLTVEMHQTDTSGGHQHELYITSDGYHSHAIAFDGGHAHATDLAPVHNHNIFGDGGHTHAISLGGGGTPVSIISPVLVISKIIYAGQQAVTAVTSGVAATEAAALGVTEEVAALRDEVAALRALFAPPRGSARLLSTPSRGPH